MQPLRSLHSATPIPDRLHDRLKRIGPVEITGTVIRLRQSSPNPTGTEFWQIFDFCPDEASSGLVAPDAWRGPPTSPRLIEVQAVSRHGYHPNQRAALRGIFKPSAQWGTRFIATAADNVSTEGKTDRVRLVLSGVKGVNGQPLLGRDRVAALLKLFPHEWENVLNGHPRLLREAIPALSEEDAQRLCAAWTEQVGGTIEATQKRLQALPGIGPALAQAITAALGRDALALIRRDPYVLAKKVRGIGFATADRVALHFGTHRNERCRALLEHAVREACEHHGHTGLPRRAAEALAARALALAEVAPADQLFAPPEDSVETICSQLLKTPDSPLLEVDGILWLTELVANEQEIAAWLSERAASTVQPLPSTAGLPAPVGPGHATERPLSAEQQAALAGILAAPVAVLTGGPGSGKTTLLAAVVAAFPHCILCAPTGRAAKRLADVTGRPASTLHRLLFLKKWVVPAGALLVVDEGSMVDLPTLGALVRRLQTKDVRVLLVGDQDQLPSVGPGQILRDVIESEKLPVFRLTRNFRTVGEGSGILRAAAELLAGQRLIPTEFSPQGDFTLVEVGSAEWAASEAVRYALEVLPQQAGLDYPLDVQVLAPMHQGSAGIEALNQILREEVNPARRGGTSLGAFRVGDRVMNTVNQPERDIFNGELGTVRAVDAAKREAVVEFNGKRLWFSATQLGVLTLAYAMSIHKSQGSEYPAVIVVLTRNDRGLINRNLLYTAFTRARRHLVVVAERGTLMRALDENAHLRTLRRTRLKGLLTGTLPMLRLSQVRHPLG